MLSVNLFCTKENKELVHEIITKYSEYGIFFITVYCPENDIDILRNYLSDLSGFVMKSDYEIDPNGSFFEIIKSWNIQGVTNFPGWCYQQYLKLKLVEKSDDLLVIMDGDTYIDPIYLHNCIKNKVITATHENIESYNKMFRNLELGIKIRDTSYIANFGIICPNSFKQNFKSIDNLYYKIYNFCITNNTQFLISEYQIFGNVMLSNNWNSQFFRFFRRGDLLPIKLFGLSRIIKISKILGFNAIAFENNHSKNFLTKILAPLLFIFGYSW